MGMEGCCAKRNIAGEVTRRIQLLYSGNGNDVFIKGYEPHTTGERGRERDGGEGREILHAEKWKAVKQIHAKRSEVVRENECILGLMGKR